MTNRKRVSLQYCAKLLGARNEVPAVLWDARQGCLVLVRICRDPADLECVRSVLITRDSGTSLHYLFRRPSGRYRVPLKAELLLGA